MPAIMTLLRRYALKKRIYVKAEHGLMGILAAAVSRTPICFVLFMLWCFCDGPHPWPINSVSTSLKRNAHGLCFLSALNGVFFYFG